MRGHIPGQHSRRARSAPVRRNSMPSFERTTRVLVSAVVLSAGIVGLSGQGRDPRTGTWILNVAKSTYKPGPAPKSQTVRIEPSGQGEHVRADALNPNGTRVV